MKHIQCPEEFTGASPELSVFLAGGITNTPNWQPEMVKLLSDTNLTLVNPRRGNFPIDDPTAAEQQIRWEHKHLLRVNAILFWFPCETLCPITLFELGSWIPRPKPLFVGCHPEYKRINDVRIQTKLERPFFRVVESLENLADMVRLWGETYPKGRK